MILRSVIIAVFGVFAVATPAFCDDDKYTAYVNVPYEWEYYSDGVFKLDMGNGNTLGAYYIKFIKTRMKLSEAVAEYGSTYDELARQLDLESQREGTVMSKAQSTYNLKAWTSAVADEISRGYNEQTLLNQKNVASMASETDAQISAQTAKYNELAANQNATASSIKSTITSLDAKLDTRTSSLSSDINALNSQLNAKMQSLSQLVASGSTSQYTQSEIDRLQSEIEKILVQLETAKGAVVAIRGNTIFDNPEMYVYYSTYTNDMRRISQWLGFADNPAAGGLKNFGAFMRPNDFYDSTKTYGVANDFTDMFGDMGFVGATDENSRKVLSGEAQGQFKFYNPNTFWRRFDFYEENGVTNVYAYPFVSDNGTYIGFLAPKNWADGITVVYSNGQYHVQKSISDTTNIAHVVNAITNMFTTAINMQNSFDGKSVWTNSDSKVEIRGFKNVENTDEYDFIPVRVATFGTYETAHIEWQTNDMPALKAIVGLKKTPTKEDIEEGKISNPQYFEDYYVDGSIAKIVLGHGGMTNMPMQTLDSNNMLDNASVWTNAEKKIEIKGYKTSNAYTVPYQDINQSIIEQGKDKAMVWEPLPFADNNGSSRFGVAGHPSSIEANMTVTPDSSFTWRSLSLMNFPNAGFFSIPYKKNVSGTQTDGGTLMWATPPSGVTEQNKKVLTFDGTDVAWGDSPGGGAALRVYTDGLNGSSGDVTIGSGATTNAIKFASESNSNVKYTVSNVNGEIQVKIGVYYTNRPE